MTEETLIFDKYLSILACSSAIILAIIGSVVNGTTCFVILHRRSLRLFHPIAPLLFYLAISDFILCFLCLPVLAIRFALRNDYIQFVGISFCKIWAAFNYADVIVLALT